MKTVACWLGAKKFKLIKGQYNPETAFDGLLSHTTSVGTAGALTLETLKEAYRQLAEPTDLELHQVRKRQLKIMAAEKDCYEWLAYHWGLK